MRTGLMFISNKRKENMIKRKNDYVKSHVILQHDMGYKIIIKLYSK